MNDKHPMYLYFIGKVYKDKFGKLITKSNARDLFREDFYFL